MIKEEQLYVAPHAVLEKLRAFIAGRDEQARILGLASAEHLLRVGEISRTYEKGSSERHLRLGAAYEALLDIQDDVMSRIVASKAEEAVLANSTLAALGCDPKKSLRFDLNNGAVLELAGASWQPLLREVI